MSTIAYPYVVKDSANTSTDNRKTGLTPTISDGKTLAASPATVTASGNVTVVEIGSGTYIALYDAESHGDASFPIDWGSTLTNPNDRYGALVLTRDPGRVLNAITATGDLAGKLLGGGTGTISGVGTNANITQLNGATVQDESIHEGTAQGGTTTTIVLATSANSTTDHVYRNCVAEIISGTGFGQAARRIASYVASTRTATVDPPWLIAPDTTTVYRVGRGVGGPAPTYYS